MPSGREVMVREIMMEEPITLGSNDILDLADDVMALSRIRHLPILENGKVVGVLSQRDLFRSALVRAMELSGKEQKDLLKGIWVKEVMSRPVITVTPETTVKKAARLMMEKKIGCLPVVEGEILVGLVTETDMLRYVMNL